MTPESRFLSIGAALVALLAFALPVAAGAQSIAYGMIDETEVTPDQDEPSRDTGKQTERSGVHISPYIEAAQIATAELAPGNDVLTYSRLVAGVDADITGRNTEASFSLRYEHYFGWGSSAEDSDVISGIARAYTQIAPGLRIEAGAMAESLLIENNGASVLGQGFGDDESQVYSLYAGPTIATQAGDVLIDASYQFGYTKVESPDTVAFVPGQPPVDVFDESVVHNAYAHAGVNPDVVLPVGMGLGGGYYREDISNLDQRLEDFHARADVTVPVSGEVALVGGIGYENVEVSSRDALRDASGNPVIDSDGHFVTDNSGPRHIAYDTSGFIWDAGVIWRPSRRTELEAHVGRRYGSTSFYGSFDYAPNSRSSINISVYDNIAGFGGQLNRALAGLPAQFEANRNPLTGDLTGCVASQEEGNCLSSALGSVRSSIFHASGVMANYSFRHGQIDAGIGAGYDRRKFIAAPGTVLESSDGVVDENIWISGYLNDRVSARGTLSTVVYANWFQSGSASDGDSSALGASASYDHAVTDHLTATAALGLYGTLRDAPLPDVWEASALVGVRYRF